MKSLLTLFVSLTLTCAAQALTPLLALEKGSHRLETLFKKSQVDKSFETDISYVTVANSSQGYVLTWFSASNDQNHPNSITMKMGTDGKVTDQNVDFVSANSGGPIFRQANVATLFDLGTEAVVDHLSESAELPEVAAGVTSIQMTNENNQVLLQMKLTDGRIYKVVLDQDGQFISRGF